MKRLALAIVLMVGLTSTAHAAPFLIAAPQSDANSYNLSIDGGPWFTAQFTATPPFVALRHDLAGSPAATVGRHRIDIKAVDTLWGQESEIVPFEYDVVRPSTPSDVGLAAQ